jgi:hypothetical protein
MQDCDLRSCSTVGYDARFVLLCCLLKFAWLVGCLWDGGEWRRCGSILCRSDPAAGVCGVKFSTSILALNDTLTDGLCQPDLAVYAFRALFSLLA